MRRLLLLLIGLLCVMPVGGCALSGAGEPEPVESFVEQLLTTQYSRPIPADARKRLRSLYDSSVPEARTELGRILVELDGSDAIMRQIGASYRRSQVNVTIHSVRAEGPSVHVVADVLGEWTWGYPGKRDEITQVYNLHELLLVRSGPSWRVVMDRNLASNPKTQVQLTVKDR